MLLFIQIINRSSTAALLELRALHMNASQSLASEISETMENNNIQRNLELFTCVWLDQNINETDDNRETEQKLRQIINHLLTSNNDKQCEEYIRNIIQEKVVLIVSGALGQHVIPRIHDLIQVAACYVFCSNIDFHKQWANRYSKVKGVFDEIGKLILKVSEDQSCRAKFEEGASISVINPSYQSIEERNTMSMWFQLYIEVLLRMHHKLTDRKELFDLCKNACKNNNYELNIIYEFEKTYKSEDAVRWYTRESCLYRMLNKALRFQDFDTLFTFRFFLADVAKQLKTEYEKLIRTSKTREIIQVYRGQSAGNDEIELMKNNVGQFLSMNSFFSTSLTRSTALDFIRSLPVIKGIQHVILFEITIDLQLQTKPFANIREKSFYQKEDEILIMVGALFQIKQIFYDSKTNIWIACLSLADESDYRLQDTFAHMKDKIGEETTLASLGKIFFEMGEYDQVEKCYRHMMNDAQFDLSTAHSGLSKAALGKKNFDQAAEYEQQALTIKTSLLPANHRDLAISYSRLGDIYCKQNNHKQALKYLKKAMKIQEKLGSAEPLVLAKTYNRIALTCVDLNDYQLALHFYDKALKIRQENLPPIDKSIASIFHNMGKLHHKQNELTQALDYYRNALEIYQKLLPSKHPHIIQIDEDIRNLKKQMKKK